MPAFPGAQGGGATSKGGRGGTVIKVTNLNDSGPGSLRACVTATGPRTCVFTVSGVIQLQSSMYVSNPYLTIAGQTAPGAGIAVKQNPNASNESNAHIFNIRTHDVTIRYLKIWGDSCSVTGPCSYGLSLHTPASNVIVDHATILWFTGEAFDGGWESTPTTPLENMTVQWSIMGEPVTTPQSTAVRVGNSAYDPKAVRQLDFHHNLITSSNTRGPELSSESARLISNAIYNWSVWSTELEKGTTADVIGNYWKPGISSKNCKTEIAYGQIGNGGSLYLGSNVNETNISEFNPNCAGTTRATTVTGTEADFGWSKLLFGTGVYQGNITQYPLAASYKRSPWARLAEPAGYVRISVTPAAQVASTLSAAGGVGASARVDCNGAWVNQRDATENRVVSNFLNNTGRNSNVGMTTAVGWNGGALPTLGGGSACADSDGDGMPDAWETAHGLNPSDASDASRIAADGYSNLEHFINGQ